jgi:hypothetical protein
MPEPLSDTGIDGHGRSITPKKPVGLRFPVTLLTLMACMAVCSATALAWTLSVEANRGSDHVRISENVPDISRAGLIPANRMPERTDVGEEQTFPRTSGSVRLPYRSDPDEPVDVGVALAAGDFLGMYTRCTVQHAPDISVGTLQGSDRTPTDPGLHRGPQNDVLVDVEAISANVKLPWAALTIGKQPIPHALSDLPGAPKQAGGILAAVPYGPLIALNVAGLGEAPDRLTSFPLKNQEASGSLRFFHSALVYMSGGSFHGGLGTFWSGRAPSEWSSSSPSSHNTSLSSGDPFLTGLAFCSFNNGRFIARAKYAFTSSARFRGPAASLSPSSERFLSKFGLRAGPTRVLIGYGRLLREQAPMHGSLGDTTPAHEGTHANRVIPVSPGMENIRHSLYGRLDLALASNLSVWGGFESDYVEGVRAARIPGRLRSSPDRSPANGASNDPLAWDRPARRVHVGLKWTLLKGIDVRLTYAKHEGRTAESLWKTAAGAGHRDTASYWRRRSTCEPVDTLEGRLSARF